MNTFDYEDDKIDEEILASSLKQELLLTDTSQRMLKERDLELALWFFHNRQAKMQPRQVKKKNPARHSLPNKFKGLAAASTMKPPLPVEPQTSLLPKREENLDIRSFSSQPGSEKNKEFYDNQTTNAMIVTSTEGREDSRNEIVDENSVLVLPLNSGDLRNNLKKFEWPSQSDPSIKELQVSREIFSQPYQISSKQPYEENPQMATELLSSSERQTDPHKRSESLETLKLELLKGPTINIT